MNKLLFEGFIAKEPQSDKEKYIFIMDNPEMALAILTVGFKSVYLAKKDDEINFSLDSFINHMGEIGFNGKFRNDYIYALGCDAKKTNDKLETYLKSESLNYRSKGWQIFKGKEYLANNGKSKELKQALETFINRFEGSQADSQLELAQFHLTDDNGKITGVFDDAILEYIKQNFNLFFMAGTPYFYENGLFKADFSGAKLKTMIKNIILPKFRKSTTITRIYQLFSMDYELQRSYEELNQYPEHWVPFKDCMVDGKTGERHEHKPEYYCINQIPWDYPTKPCSGEITEQFFKFAMSEEDRRTVLQYLGLCMTRCNFQKFIILKGSRGTGKSVIIRLYENVIGSGNYSNVPLQKLEEKFYSIQLLGKLINMCADLNGTPLKTVNTIKLITGDDSLSDSFKGHDIVTFVPYARLLFSCNTVPISLDEKSNALFERIILIEMDNRPETPDRQLEEKLKAEIPYIISQALKELQMLFKENSLFESRRSKELVQELYADSDSVQGFIQDCMERDLNGSIKTTELMRMYKEYCQNAEREALSRTNFYRNLKSKGYGKKVVNGNEYFCGLKPKDGGFIEFDNPEELPFK